jgi:hypothetical protein
MRACSFRRVLLLAAVALAGSRGGFAHANARVERFHATERSAGAYTSGSTNTRCPSPQTMKYGPGRQLRSSSRCHRVSTRCTGAPHSWQGGEARAIRSARSIASACRSESAWRGLPPGGARRSAMRSQARSTGPERRSGTGPPPRPADRSCTARPSTEGRFACEEESAARPAEIDSLGLVVVCVSEVHSGCPRSIPSLGSPGVSARSGSGAMDRLPTADGPSAHGQPPPFTPIDPDVGFPALQRPQDRGLRDLQGGAGAVGGLEAELVESRLERLRVARARVGGAADGVDARGLPGQGLLLQDGRRR